MTILHTPWGGEFVNERYIPPAFGREPETIADALEAAACVLEEEGRWTQGTWFHHEDPEHPDYNENPYCNGWHACADGALQIVTVGLFRGTADFGNDNGTVRAWLCNAGAFTDCDEIKDRWAYYEAARRVLVDAIGEGLPPWENVGVVGFNDTGGRTRTEVVDMFRKAARRAVETGAALAPPW